MLKTLSLAAGLTLAAMPVFAETLGYNCIMSGARELEWISPTIFIAHDTDTGKVIVSDPAILGFNNGQPLDGTVTKDNAKRLSVKWNLEMRSATNQRVIMRYRATVTKADHRVTVVAQPQGYGNMFNKGGTCQVNRLKK
ncbi:hypothetical protein [Tropicibacter naphthalenivorans]|uniref:Uncharacterized protein n=1 Tax=Tropicibacter naphthalenivorans TaxID=441103 RepID=A0A0P1GEI9_9RHOB|nr:hypothetical protein [Tropicibacter naphthalenivorans]CUH80023.1 hypothetical protein TRN7648_02747 [Tropicibacter naphthalenivorans]SMC83545.1 hypothetical protein SAMN04488093_10516 [Tropicibacter naphthalenivorans]